MANFYIQWARVWPVSAVTWLTGHGGSDDNPVTWWGALRKPLTTSGSFSMACATFIGAVLAQPIEVCNAGEITDPADDPSITNQTCIGIAISASISKTLPTQAIGFIAICK
jgi:hypothetical protein